MRGADAPAALQHGKARSGQLGSKFEVQPKRLPQIDVVPDLERERGRLATRAFERAPFADFDVAGFAPPNWNADMR
jgi:hypothetical protein